MTSYVIQVHKKCNTSYHFTRNRKKIRKTLYSVEFGKFYLPELLEDRGRQNWIFVNEMSSKRNAKNFKILAYAEV